jgi:hypothetical protein
MEDELRANEHFILTRDFFHPGVMDNLKRQLTLPHKSERNFLLGLCLMGVHDPCLSAVYGTKNLKINKKSIYNAIHFVQFAIVKSSLSNIFLIFSNFNFTCGGGKCVALIDN